MVSRVVVFVVTSGSFFSDRAGSSKVESANGDHRFASPLNRRKSAVLHSEKQIFCGAKESEIGSHYWGNFEVELRSIRRS